MDDVRAVDVLEADEHLIQEELDVLVRQILRRPDHLVQVCVHELEHLRVGRGHKSVEKGQEMMNNDHTTTIMKIYI